jgi:hypothetical protein
MELVSIDFLKIEPSKGGIENVLVIVDHFTRFAQAIPCRNQTAAITAKALYEGYFRYYGFPEQLHSDQGRNFLSKTITELCKLAGIKKTRTTPYHPMGNGAAERWNQTLLKMLGTLQNHQKSDWKSYIAPLVQAYNATKSDATGYAPHFLMFGWHPRLPVDAYLGTDPSEESTSTSRQSYATKLKQRMQFAYRQAAEESSKNAGKNKRLFDKKVIKQNRIDPGDTVLIRKVGLQGTHKLADRWDEHPYTVLSIPNPDLPVYRVQLCNKTGPIKTLHRNMLLPYTIPSHTPSSLPSTRKSSTDQAQTKKVQSKSPPVSLSSPESSDDSDGSSGIYIPPPLRKKAVQRRQTLPNSSTNSSLSTGTGFTFGSSGFSQTSSVSTVGNNSPSVTNNVTGSPLRNSLSRNTNQSSVGNRSPVTELSHHSVPPIRSPYPTRHRRPPDKYDPCAYMNALIGEDQIESLCDDHEVFV